MSERYPGGIINQTAPVPSGTYANSAASGVWTMNQQAYWVQQGLWPIPGNFPNYIEDVFSTYLYEGNGSTQTITNDIDLAGEGGMTWIKVRNTSGYHAIVDTVRGASKILASNSTDAQATDTAFTSFNSNGFTVADDPDWYTNRSSQTYASWTFREQAKFFDIVTYTGNGVNGRTVAHNLGSVPGMIIVKCTSSAESWRVYHRSLGATKALTLNSTSAESTSNIYWNDTEPTSSVFSVYGYDGVNGAGLTYVAYLFAHDAGGFGESGTDNVISCGSFTGLATVDLGYEPQWIIYKTSGSANSGWLMVDNMRGFTSGNTDPYLEANSSAAEQGGNDLLTITSTGFKNNLFASDTFIYMAIRRPMKVPTDATTVFSPQIKLDVTVANGLAYNFGFPPDAVIEGVRGGASYSPTSTSRLIGNYQYMITSSNDAEASDGGYRQYTQSMQGMTYGIANNSTTFVGWGFVRRPGFFDQVCYVGQDTSEQIITHNLGVAPELIISKARNSANDWWVYAAPQGRSKYARLNTTGAFSTLANAWGTSDPTATQYGFYASAFGDAAGVNVTSYLFATVAGVSKVGSYSGTGATQTINCGFTGGARFVLIKRTDSTGSWYVWDTARGMVSGTDPKIALNSTAAESNANWVYTETTGFQIVTTDASVNASGGTYIFLAIA